MIQVATNDGALVIRPPQPGAACDCCGRRAGDDAPPDVVPIDVTAFPQGLDPHTARVLLCGDCLATANSVHLSALELRPCPHRES